MPSGDDLRCAAENLYILNLRGSNITLSGRNIADQARALVLYSRIPSLLVPRFPEHKLLLCDFKSFREYHAVYGKGLAWNGVPCQTPKELPVFALESVEKLVQEVFEPLYQYKRHATLCATKDRDAPFQCSWVRSRNSPVPDQSGSVQVWKPSVLEGLFRSVLELH